MCKQATPSTYTMCKQGLPFFFIDTVWWRAWCKKIYIVWFGTVQYEMVWYPIQLLWHGVPSPEWWEGGSPRLGRRLMCWDIAINRSSFATCTYIQHKLPFVWEKVCLNMASYGIIWHHMAISSMSSGINPPKGLFSIWNYPPWLPPKISKSL